MSGKNMQHNLYNLKNTCICKMIIVMTMSRNMMAVGTIMPMHQEKEIMEVKQNLNNKIMNQILILLQARPCRS
eukprot:12887871-Prorocentrum_lima.AAC.1